MTTERLKPVNITFAIGGFSGAVDSFVVADNSGRYLSLCAEKCTHLETVIDYLPFLGDGAFFEL